MSKIKQVNFAGQTIFCGIDVHRKTWRAAYILIGESISQIMDGGKAVTIGMIFASAQVLPIAIADGLLTHFKPVMFVSGLGLALLSSAIPFTLEMKALVTERADSRNGMEKL